MLLFFLDESLLNFVEELHNYVNIFAILWTSFQKSVSYHFAILFNDFPSQKLTK